MAKTPTLENKFDALLDLVVEGDEEFDDNSLRNNFVDATQIINDESESIENSIVSCNQNFLLCLILTLTLCLIILLALLW